MKDDGFQTVLVRDVGRKNKGQGNLYVKRVFEALQRQAKLCERDDSMLYPERKEDVSAVISPITTTTLFIGAMRV